MPDMDGPGVAGGAPAAPALDVDAMRQRMGDDDELNADVIRIFLQDYPSRLAAISSAIEARDPVRVRATAHAMKGGASTLAASGVVQAALAVEAIGTSGDLALADARFASLAAETERLAAALRGLQAGS